MPTALDLRTPSTGGNSFVTDICRLFLARRSDTWLPTSTWVRALTALSLSDAGARTALHRMTKGGYLEKDKRGPTAGYVMSRPWQQLMQDLEGITPQEPGWLLVTFTVPEEQREDRRQLRTLLARQGFAALGGGTWLGSARKTSQVRSLLRLFELEHYVDLFGAQHLGPRSTPQLAARCWDLGGIAAEYRALAKALRSRASDEPDAAFVHLVVHASRYRLLRERDPDVPPEALPATWPAADVEALMATTVAAYHRAAESFLAGEE